MKKEQKKIKNKSKINNIIRFLSKKECSVGTPEV